jgi:ribonuclease Z
VKLTLLGTGTPIPDVTRKGPSQVIEAGTSLVVVDTGRGCVDRLLEAGYGAQGGRALKMPLAAIALTHLHSDHLTGLPDLLWAGWVMRWWERPPVLIGPPGTADMLSHLVAAFSYDIAVRKAGEAGQIEELVPEVVEVEEGWAREGDGWRLSGFRVKHEPVDQAFGFRMDCDGRSIVVSGDTRYSENLIGHSQGADILVHEAYSRAGMAMRREAAVGDPRQELQARTISSYHTPANEAGKAAAQAEASHLVLSHVVFGRGGTAEEVTGDAANHFPRQITLADDLQSFEL